jgi:hypothetical protein
MVSFVCLLFVVFERKRCKKRIFRAPITFKEWKTKRRLDATGTDFILLYLGAMVERDGKNQIFWSQN